MFRRTPIETVAQLEHFPRSSVGAPSPMVLASEYSLAVVFYTEKIEAGWDGASVRMVGLDSPSEHAVVVTFERPLAHVFGPPNDEAFAGHRLAAVGLVPYAAFEVINSKWIHDLERQNAVHPQHDKEHYLNGKRHFILTFHDSTFECVAQGYSVELVSQSVREAGRACLSRFDA